MKLTLKSKDFKKNRELFLLSLPAVIFVFIFSYIPMGGIVLAFKDYKYDLGILGSKWNGLYNFKFIFSGDIFRLLRNTIGMNAIFIVTGTIASVVFGLMLFELSRSSVKVYQTIMFFPYFLSWVVVGFLFTGLFDVELGLINGLLKSIGLQPVFWYSEPSYWPIILAFVHLWKCTGNGAIIYYAALMGVNSEYYEVARLEGANRLQQIRYISIPMLMPLITILTLLSVGKILNADFGMFYFLTKDTGALYSTTDVMDTYVYRTLRVLGDTGMSAAAGFFQSMVGFALVLFSNSVVKKINSENSLF